MSERARRETNGLTPHSSYTPFCHSTSASDSATIPIPGGVIQAYASNRHLVVDHDLNYRIYMIRRMNMICFTAIP